MSGQPGKNVIVAYKVESVFGTPVSGSGAEKFRIQPGGGLSMTRELIEDPEVRTDGQRSMARLGSKSVSGSYRGTLSVGTFNTFLEALFRSTWVADAVAITCDGGAVYTSLAVTTQNTLTLVGTESFLTQGVRVGDVIHLGATGGASDNVNAVVATVAANVITVLGTPWTNFTADTNATLTIKKKLKNGSTLTRRSFTIEEYFEDLDESEIFPGCRVVSLRLTFGPNQTVNVEFGLMGQDMTIGAAGGSTPIFTTPTEYVSIGLVAVDASIYVAGAAIATITGGELLFELNAQGQAVVGSVLTPDIFEGPMKVTGQITAVRTLLTSSHLARFLAETDNVELSLLFVEPDAAAPIDFVHVFVPRLKYLGVTANLGDDGALIETIPVYAAAKATTTGYDAATATISTSA
jgi:hypothetical protein